MTVIVAGMGNVLRGDDGFGVAVAERLSRGSVPDGVRVMDVGIGGIHLVQELLPGCRGLVVVDALDVGRPPGSVVVMRPDVRDLRGLSWQSRRDELADVHYATPERALMLARAMDRLPEETWIVGCQAADAQRLGEGLSPTLQPAVGVAADEVRRLVSRLGVRWD